MTVPPNNPSESPDDPVDPRALADILARRRHASDAAPRERLVASLDRLASGRPDAKRDHEVAGFLALLARSSLADPEPVTDPLQHDPDAVARLLDREVVWRTHDEEHSGAPAGEADTTEDDPDAGAARDWCREIRRLLPDEPAEERAVAALRARDHRPDGDLGVWSLATGEEAARSLVDVLGEDWATGNYRHLYRSARLDLGFREASGPGFTRVKGVIGAVTADPRSAAIAVEAGPRRQPWSLARRRLVADLGAVINASASTSTVLLGDTGAGKSTAALAAGDLARAGGASVFWFPAGDVRALVVGLERVAIRLARPVQELVAARHDDPAVHAEALWRLLDASERPWVVVLDDAGERAVGRPAWTRRPKSGHVIVTTRYGDAEAWTPSTVVEIGGLDADDGARVLLDRLDEVVDDESGSREEKAREISKLLSGVPVALVVVGELVARSEERSLAPWVERLVPSLPGGAVATVYELALDALGRHRDDGRRLLRLLASFAPDEMVPEQMLAGAPERRWGEHGGLARHGIDELVRVGLVRRVRGEVDGDALRLHSAIAEHVRRDLDDPTVVRDLDHRAVRLLADRRDRLDAGRPAAWSALLALTPHVTELVESRSFALSAADEDMRADVLDLADRQAQALVRMGQPESAANLLAAAVRFGDMPEDHPSILSTRLTRAWMTALLGGGGLPEAERQLRELVDVTSRALGPAHKITLAAHDTLAWALAEQDHHEQAEQILSYLLDVRLGLLHRHHREILATRHRLAWIHGLRGNLEQARAEFEHVLAHRYEVLGADHLDVYGTRYRLAWVHSRLGDHITAMVGFDALLLDVEAVLDRAHPLAHLVRSRRAWARMWAGDLETARSMYATLLPDQEKVLGRRHPRRLTDAHNHAAIRLQLGEVQATEQDLRDIVDLRSEVLGVDHPLTLDSRELHAWALLRSGRAELADRELLAVLSDRRRTLGGFHETTLATRYRVMRVVLHRGRIADAEERARQLLVDLEDADVVALAQPGVPNTTVSGVVTPRTTRRSLRLSVEQSLALARGLQGRAEEARGLLRRVVAERSEYLGAEHRDTLVARDHHAWALVLTGRRDEGVAEAAAVLAARERDLGPHHPHTFTSRARLAWAWLQRGRTVAALEAYDALRTTVASELGKEHPLTLRVRGGWVQALRLSGRTAEAYGEAVALHVDQVRVQGPRAVDTLRALEERGQAAEARGRRDEAIACFDDVRAERHRVFRTADHLDVRRIDRLLRGLMDGRASP
ncbi:tetratricopeptide repeat protein [Actinomycetospora flava]|uniref:Tetratricopeptide repeat protein n=1 Tax=Actinomycetospora flava TaxID=3129232 RepID=A0ABU8M521_9PSEU